MTAPTLSSATLGSSELTTPNRISAATATVTVKPLKTMESGAAAGPVSASSTMPESVRRRLRRERALGILAPILGIFIMLLIWEAIAKAGQTIPGPLATGKAAVTVLSHPFYDNGPNDQGIGYKVLNSLGRVGLGFGLAALAAFRSDSPLAVSSF